MSVRNVMVNTLLVLISVSISVAVVEYLLAYDSRHPNTNQFMNDVILNGSRYRFLETLESINHPSDAVLIVGDSFTAGNACADNNTYPSAFTKAAARNHSRLHAINMGVPETGPVSYVLRIRDYLAAKGPTAGIIVTLYANDVEIDCPACRQSQEWSHFGNLTPEDQVELTQLCRPCLKKEGERQKVAGQVSVGRQINWWLAERSRLYQLLREAAAKVAVGTGLLDVNWGRGAFVERWRDLNSIYFKYVQASIGVAKRDADRYRVPLMVVIYPDPLGINNSNEYVAIYDNVRRSLSTSLVIPVYSGYEAFLDNPLARENMPFSLTDAHPSCKAHEIFGDWVFAKWSNVGSSQVQ